MRTMRTAAVALALATVIAGCGRGGGTEEVAVVRQLDLLQGVEAEGSARISVTIDAEVPFEEEGVGLGSATRMSMDSEGVVAFGGETSTWSGTWAVEGVPPEGSVDELAPTPAFRFEEITLDGGRWARMWIDGEEAPAWEDLGRLDEAYDAAEAGGDLLANPFAIDPARFLEQLRDEAGSVTQVGEEEVRGAATTRYRAEVDAAAVAVAGVDPDEATTVDVWVDEEDRLRRVEAGDMVVELWDFGTPVEAEEPADVTDGSDLGNVGRVFFTQVTGEWEAVARGVTGGVGWTVHAAPGDHQGSATTCRTLELDGDPVPEGAGDVVDGYAEGIVGELPLPTHDGVLAACGNDGFGGFPGGFVPEPSVQVLTADSAMEIMGGMGDEPAAAGPVLVGFVVAPRRVAGGLTLVRAGAEPVEVPLDAAGVAVWDGAGSRPVVAIELDGGAIRCSLLGEAEGEEDLFEGDDELGPLDAGLGAQAPVCVEA